MSPSGPSETPHAPPLSGELDLIEWSRSVGERLARWFGAVLDELEIGSRRPRDVGERLGLNRDIAGRLIALTGAATPFETIFVSPGPEPLRKVLRTAETLGVSGPTLASAAAAVDDFEALIERGAGTRGRLETTLGSVDAEIRQRTDLASKHAIFTGQSQLLGVQADAAVHSMILAPARDAPRWLDALIVEGLIGIQRFRPGVVIHSNSQKVMSPKPVGPEETRIEGVRFDWRGYCVNPPSDYTEEVDGVVVRRMLEEAPLGRAGLRDWMGVSAFRHVIPRFAGTDAKRERAASGIAALPSLVMTVDLLLHRSIRPQRAPYVRVYDLKASGRAYIHDRRRDSDIVDARETIEELGDADTWSIEELPRYTEMLTDLLASAGYDASEFHCYRLRTAYPMVNWQYAVIFDAPEGDAGG